jgi:hypothetical protein
LDLRGERLQSQKLEAGHIRTRFQSGSVYVDESTADVELRPSCISTRFRNLPKGLQIPLIENLASHQGTYDTLNLTDNSLTILGNIPLCELLLLLSGDHRSREVARWDPIWREVSGGRIVVVGMQTTVRR